MAVIGKQYAVTGTAVSLTHADILNTAANVAGTYAQELVIKNAAGAANAAYIGGSDVTAVPANAYGQISAGTEYRISASYGNPIRLDKLYVIGTTNGANILFITAVI